MKRLETVLFGGIAAALLALIYAYHVCKWAEVVSHWETPQSVTYSIAAILWNAFADTLNGLTTPGAILVILVGAFFMFFMCRKAR